MLEGHNETAADTATPSIPAVADIPVEDADTLTYHQFVERYMAPNLPVLIRVSV